MHTEQILSKLKQMDFTIKNIHLISVPWFHIGSNSEWIRGQLFLIGIFLSSLSNILLILSSFLIYNIDSLKLAYLHDASQERAVIAFVGITEDIFSLLMQWHDGMNSCRSWKFLSSMNQKHGGVQEKR